MRQPKSRGTFQLLFGTAFWICFIKKILDITSLSRLSLTSTGVRHLLSHTIIDWSNQKIKPRAQKRRFYKKEYINCVLGWIILFHQSTLSNKNKLAPNVCNEQKFDDLQFALNKIFLNKKIIRLLNNASFGIPFASQLVNYSSRNWSLKAQSKVLFWRLWGKIYAKQGISRIFKDSLWLEQLTDLDTKGTKWSII